MNRRLFALFFILFSLTCSVTAGKKDNIEKLDKKSSGEVKQKIQMHLRLAPRDNYIYSLTTIKNTRGKAIM
jgi:hypothetical protein